MRELLDQIIAIKKALPVLFSAFCLGFILGLIQLPAQAADQTTQLALNQKVVKQLSTKQRASHEYDQALTYLQQGRVAESLDMLKTTLQTLPEHDDARLTLVTLLIENQRRDEAVQILQSGLLVSTSPVIYAETLARLQLDAGLLSASRATLEQYKLQGAHASYQALLANILQRLSKHELASTHFKNAIQTGANLPQYWIGWAVSLQALGRHAEAKQAYSVVKNMQLNPELTHFVSQRLKQLN